MKGLGLTGHVAPAVTRRFDPDLALAIETRSRQTVHVHKVVDAEGGEARLYCYSEARAKKEQGIANRFAARFEGEMSKLNDGLKRPRTRKRLDHVWQRIGRIREKSRGAGAHYDIDVIADDSGEKARAVTWERRPLAGRGKCATGRAWVYVRDDRPFGGPDPPAALFRYSRDRSGDHPVEHLKTFAGIFQADIYAGYNALYVAGRSPGPVTEAACWSHSRRKFFELADIAASARRGKNAPPISPLALEAVKRIDVLFDIERGINGESAEHRLAVRKEFSAPVLADLKDWMQAERRKLSRHSPVAKAMDYMLRRWELFARFLDDGRICLTNNAAERALRGIALGRKSWLFCGSDRGGVRAAAMYTLIGTAKLNDVDPQAWLADVLGRIAETPQTRLDELLPWNWVPEQKLDQAA